MPLKRSQVLHTLRADGFFTVPTEGFGAKSCAESLRSHMLTEQCNNLYTCVHIYIYIYIYMLNLFFVCLTIYLIIYLFLIYLFIHLFSSI